MVKRGLSPNTLRDQETGFTACSTVPHFKRAEQFAVQPFCRLSDYFFSAGLRVRGQATGLYRTGLDNIYQHFGTDNNQQQRKYLLQLTNR